MATIHTLANQDKILKDWYSDDKMKELSYGENPAFAFMQKECGQMAGGRRYIQPIEFAHPDGANANYALAMTNGTTSSYEDFLISRTTQYQRVQVAHELLFATENQRGAFQKAMNEFDKGFRGLGDKIGRRMYRTRGGSIGRLSNSTMATTVMTFVEQAQVFNCYLGQKLTLAAADGTGSERDGGAFTTVTAVDYENKQVTVADTLNVKFPSGATNDFVFTQGDFGLCLDGLEGWLPVDNRATVLAAAFNNVTRSQMPDLLGGIFLDGTTMGGLDEVIIKLVGKVGKYGGNTSHIFANPESLTDLELLSNSKMRIVAELNTKVIGESGDVLVGFSGYRAIVGGRSVKIYPDRNCPSNRLYALQMDTWTLWYTGKLINWLGEDYTGHKLQMSQNDDAAESRLGSYCNIGCSAPGWNGVAKINPAS